MASTTSLKVRRPRSGPRDIPYAAAALVVLVCSGVGIAAFRIWGPYGPDLPDRRVYRDLDPKTGALRMLVYDAHGRHKPDTWSYFADNHVVLTKVDQDGDGVIDTWYHYRVDGAVEKTGFSTRHDGIEDAWRYESPEGDVLKIEYSSRRDGVVTRIDYYSNQQVVRSEFVPATLGKPQELP